MRISFDLDNVIFDIEPLYRQAHREFKHTYRAPTSWYVTECYPENVATRLIELFQDDVLYKMPLISAEYPMILNNLLQNKEYQVFFVTQRLLHQPEKSFAQLLGAGINCRFDQVYDNPKPKVEVLKKIQPDLHFDDSPGVVADCLHDGVNIAMISNQTTLYNHRMRPYVKYYSDLKTALIKTGILQR